MTKKFKKGAASMYVVVIAALLFGVITVGFIRIIVSESLRTTNDELAQSAYDSALAGVEDAKTALMKFYDNCRSVAVPGSASSASDPCQRVRFYIYRALNDPSYSSLDEKEKCRTIEQALGRTEESAATHEVQLVQSNESGVNSTTEQAYTCVTIADDLGDFTSTIGDGTTNLRVIPIKTSDPDSIKAIKIGWYDDEQISYNLSGGGSISSSTTMESYKFASSPTTPPVISVQLIQTNESFSLEDFEESNGDRTNRGTLFLAPRPRGSSTSITTINKVDDNGVCTSGTCTSGTNAFAFSNKHKQTNYPYVVDCKKDINDTSYDSIDDQYACASIMILPKPIGGDVRNRDTFFLVVSLPYGSPRTNFSVHLCNGDDANPCNSYANFKGVQTMVDSTGRANDMFSRVEARIEMTDLSFPYAEFALQLSGSNNSSLVKNFYVTKNCWTTASSSSCSDSGGLN